MEGPEGEKVLYSEHFRMKIPADLEEYELGVDQPEYSELEFYYVPAKLDGYDGTLFTLKAYDIDDDSYKELENDYVEVGTGEKKRYIVYYPLEETYGAEHSKRYHDFAEFFEGLKPDSGEDFITFTQ